MIELYDMKKLKKRLFNFLKFVCMIVVLGTQTLLQGSWTNETSNQKTA